MTPKIASMQIIREAILNHKPLDESVLEMLPEESRQIAGNGSEYIGFLLGEIDTLEQQLSDFRKALEIYCDNSKDFMARQNFDLCLLQVRNA